MEIKIRGDKLRITDAMKEYILEKIGKLDKYIENSEEVHASVVVKVRNHLDIVEITIPLRSYILRSEEEQEDFYAAVDKTVDKLERQIRKNKTKLMAKQTKPSYDFNFTSFQEEETEEPNTVIKRKTVEIKPMDEEEAILQMELIGHQFYLYKDRDTNKTAVVYKRKNGGYGVIESE